MTGSLFSQERNISATFSFAYMVYPEKNNFFDNHASSFQAGLDIWNTVKIFGEIILKDEFEEIKKSPITGITKYAVGLGFRNLMIGYKRHENIKEASGKITTIDLQYDISSFVYSKEDEISGLFLGINHQKYYKAENGASRSYNGFGISLYIDTVYTFLDYVASDGFDWFPWFKLGGGISFGKTSGFPGKDIAHIGTGEIILGMSFLFKGPITVGFNIGCHTIAYEGLDIPVIWISSNRINPWAINVGIIANAMIKF